MCILVQAVLNLVQQTSVIQSLRRPYIYYPNILEGSILPSVVRKL